ncbi:zinc finger protein 155 [Plectropomus leopardus]|uniref:zinc finger protein 155 n=1 Tax=Plectropomus leopardus TaxID=160734 RepID=UPI001C4B7A42|nr:zinc finger protein 155 [Plectropomus leopardus]
MSIEYTIDIQLTELGYTDIVQSRDTSVRETPKQTTAAPPLSACTPRNPAQSPRDKPVIKSKELTVNDPEDRDSSRPPAQQGDNQGGDNREEDEGDTAGGDPTEMQLDVEGDSDDSDVSEVYDEEEVDEEEEDYEEEEGLNNESSHSGDYRCSVCDLQLPSKFKLQDHMNLHTGARPYCCAECGKRFCQIYNYRVHLRTHAQSKDRLHCRVCLKEFPTQDDLTVHLSITHFENEFYECDLCKRVFTSLKACEYHVQQHKCRLDVVCEVCGRHFSSPKSLMRHRKRACHRNFKCTDCTKTFTKKNALLKHSFSHLGLLPYTCIRCRRHFRLAKLYRQHKCEPERIHCVACLREFLSQEDFQQHKKDTGCWGNQEPKGDEIRCLECGQRFDTTEELKKHAGAHQRVLKCAECGKGFRSALLLMSHMGGHAGKSPCLCQSCGLGFPHQQNYDSHLKTCGQTPQPASAPKKRQASKISSSETTKVNAKPNLTIPTNTAAVSAVVLNNAAAVSNNPAAPLKDCSSPGLVTGDVSSSSGPSDGLWKLTLDKQPPPGVKLVVFLPVCATQTNGLTLPPANSPTLPVPAMQVQAALSPFSNEHLGVNAALGAPLNSPLDLVTGIKRDPEWDTPLDLSKKCNSSKSALSDVPLPSIKNEPGEFEISGEAKSTEKQVLKNNYSKAIVKAVPGETDTTPLKMDPMDLSSCNVDTTSSGLKIDIKKEPQSPGPGPGPDSDSCSSRSCQLTEKDIKMETDLSRPADVEK